MAQETWTVGQVAEEFGVTVRTLHHYDEIGLLSPSERSAAGYRLYTVSDLARLQQIVVYRRLDFSLEDVRALLAEGSDQLEHLRRQRAAVENRLAQMRALVAALDDAIHHAEERTMTREPATAEDLKDLFGDGYDESYAIEAEQRWGDTPQWRQSQERNAGRSKEDWQRIKDEGEAVNADFAAAMDAGLPATSEQAMAAAERHHRSIEEHYDCPYAMHRGLGDMYVSDPRFSANYEAVRPGLAQYVRDAIHANADRHEAH